MNVERILVLADNPEELQRDFVPVDRLVPHLKDYWIRYGGKSEKTAIAQTGASVGAMGEIIRCNFVDAGLFTSSGENLAFISVDVLEFFGRLKTKGDLWHELTLFRRMIKKPGNDSWGTSMGDKRVAALGYASRHALADWNKAHE